MPYLHHGIAELLEGGACRVRHSIHTCHLSFCGSARGGLRNVTFTEDLIILIVNSSRQASDTQFLHHCFIKYLNELLKEHYYRDNQQQSKVFCADKIKCSY